MNESNHREEKKNTRRNPKDGVEAEVLDADFQCFLLLSGRS